MASNVNNATSNPSFYTSIPCQIINGFANTQEIEAHTENTALKFLLNMLNYLDAKSLGKCAQLNRFFHRVVHGSVCDRIWKSLRPLEHEIFFPNAIIAGSKSLSGIKMQVLFKITEMKTPKYRITPFLEPRLTAVDGSNIHYFNKYDWGVMTYSEDKPPDFLPFVGDKRCATTCLAVDSNFFYLGHEDGFVSCWEKNGRLHNIFENRYRIISRLVTCTNRLVTIMTTDDGPVVQHAQLTDSTISIWNIQSHMCQWTNFFEEAKPDLVATEGSTLFCPYRNQIALIDLSTGQVSNTIGLNLPEQKIKITCSKSFNNGVAFGTADGAMIVLWQTLSGSLSQVTVRGPNEAVLAVEVDYPFMLSASHSSLIFWNLADKKQLEVYGQIKDVRFIQKRINDFFLHNGRWGFSMTLEKQQYLSDMQKQAQSIQQTVQAKLDMLNVRGLK